MIDLKTLSKEHEQLFPNATAESQLFKMEEEVTEFFNAQGTDKSLKELADCIIVCVGLYRFCPNFARKTVDEIINANIADLEKLDQEVARKWEVNKSRKWQWNGKTYKHIGVDGNE